MAETATPTGASKTLVISRQSPGFPPAHAHMQPPHALRTPADPMQGCENAQLPLAPWHYDVRRWLHSTTLRMLGSPHHLDAVP